MADDNLIKQGIEPMKRVVLSISAGTSPEYMDITPQPFIFDFIHGLGAEGLSKFEQLLIDKKMGETVTMRLPVAQHDQFLGNLSLPPMLMPSEVETLYLQVTVDKVETASGREVIRELALIAGCGDGCCDSCH